MGPIHYSKIGYLLSIILLALFVNWEIKCKTYKLYAVWTVCTLSVLTYHFPSNIRTLIKQSSSDCWLQRDESVWALLYKCFTGERNDTGCQLTWSLCMASSLSFSSSPTSVFLLCRLWISWKHSHFKMSRHCVHTAFPHTRHPRLSEHGTFISPFAPKCFI